MRIPFTAKHRPFSTRQERKKGSRPSSSYLVLQEKHFPEDQASSTVASLNSRYALWRRNWAPP